MINQVVKTWDGNNINDATNYITTFELLPHALPRASVTQVPRSGRTPLIGNVAFVGDVVILKTIIENDSSATTLRGQLRKWFDPSDNTPKQLIVTGEAGADQYIYGVVESHTPTPKRGAVEFITAIRVHGDSAWRRTATSTTNWNLSATGATRAISNNGEFPTFPTFAITPTSAKTGTNPYKRFMSVSWRAGAAALYPVDIANGSLDTRTSVTNFASATGADMRVYVNGAAVDFWVVNPNTTTTKIWVNLDFQAGQLSNLAASIGTGSISSIDVVEDITNFPNSGILRINNELFLYSSKNNNLRRFFIESRGAKGTTVGSHSAGVGVRWIQHDIVLTYGNASLSAYPTSDARKPMFLLSGSTNTSWDFDDFGDDTGLRAAQWQKGINQNDWSINYTADSTAATPGTWSDASPWSELGLYRSRVDIPVIPSWHIYNPCGITNANFVNGQKYAGFGFVQWAGYIVSGKDFPSQYSEHQIPDPTANGVWQTWSRNEALTSGAVYVGLRLEWISSGAGGSQMYLEVADVTLTLDSSKAPAILVVAEQGNYDLNATLTNNRTGDAIAIQFQMELNQTLTINTDTGEVTYNKDGSNQYSAIRRIGGPRMNWLSFLNGSNTIQFDDTGTAGVTIVVTFQERYGA